jgi:hypothetical protein
MVSASVSQGIETFGRRGTFVSLLAAATLRRPASMRRCNSPHILRFNRRAESILQPEEASVQRSHGRSVVQAEGTREVSSTNNPETLRQQYGEHWWRKGIPVTIRAECAAALQRDPEPAAEPCC